MLFRLLFQLVSLVLTGSLQKRVFYTYSSFTWFSRPENKRYERLKGQSIASDITDFSQKIKEARSTWTGRVSRLKKGLKYLLIGWG